MSGRQLNGSIYQHWNILGLDARFFMKWLVMDLHNRIQHMNRAGIISSKKSLNAKSGVRINVPLTFSYYLGGISYVESLAGTVKSADTMQTAEEIARENSFNEIAESFKPSFDQIVDIGLLSSFQTRLDAFIRDILHHHKVTPQSRAERLFSDYWLTSVL